MTTAPTDVLTAIEARAARLEAIDELVEASAQRRILLIELDEAGLLRDDPSGETAARLEALALPLLSAYHMAALQLLAYLASDTRRAEVRGARPQGVLGAPVSLDWFRLGVEPHEGLDAFGWAAYAESTFRDADLGPGGGGELLVRHGGPWYRLRWRRDDGVTPALLSMTPA